MRGFVPFPLFSSFCPFPPTLAPIRGHVSFGGKDAFVASRASRGRWWGAPTHPGDQDDDQDEDDDQDDDDQDDDDDDPNNDDQDDDCADQFLSRW